MADGDYGLSNAINTLSRQIDNVARGVYSVESKVDAYKKQTMNEILKIRQELIEMDRRQRLTASLQRAITEVIQIRQELEQKYGTNKKVRDSMLGILQATDLSLIKNTTISQVSEELMISAPKYWLAPALIALSAWIGGNESLAKRALEEACRRDDTRTSLLFALITRRVNIGRIANGKPAKNTCFKWLARYFSHLDAKKMNRSIMAYLDAYSNNVFGYDEDGICDAHINKWLKQLEKDPTFKDEQINKWLATFNSFVDTKTSDKFLALKQVCVQYPQINAYISRIEASEKDAGIKDYVQDILDAPVDTQKLIDEVDTQLMNLVSTFDDDEAPLRNEERYWNTVKELKGDEELTTKRLAYIADMQKRKNAPVDFAERLRHSVFDQDTSASEKKTALKLLKPYVSEAFDKFIHENKESYPEIIDLRITEPGNITNGTKFTWEGQTKNAENKEELFADLASRYEKEKEEAIAKVDDEPFLKKKKTGKIMMFTVIFLIIPVGPILYSKGNKGLKNNEATREAIAKYYDDNKVRSEKLLEDALEARNEANKVVEDFLLAESNETLNIR